MDEATLTIGVRSMDEFFEGVAEAVEKQGCKSRGAPHCLCISPPLKTCSKLSVENAGKFFRH